MITHKYLRTGNGYNRGTFVEFQVFGNGWMESRVIFFLSFQVNSQFDAMLISSEVDLPYSSPKTTIIIILSLCTQYLHLVIVLLFHSINAIQLFITNRNNAFMPVTITSAKDVVLACICLSVCLSVC